MGRLRVLNTALLALAGIALIACSGSGNVVLRSDAPGASVLPPIPVSHGASELTETLLNGIDAYSMSAGATGQGTALSIVSAAGGFEWAAYRFNPGPQVLDSVAVLLSVPQGSSVWIALSDYAAGCWCMHGPYANGKTLALDDSQYTSPAGDLYVAVVVSGGSSAVVEALSVRTIRPPNQPPTASLTAAPAYGDAPLTVSFDASGSSDPDGTIRYYLWDFDGDGGYERTTFTPTTAYTYTAVGMIKVTVAAVDDEGAYGTARVWIVVSVPGNTAPTASLAAAPAYGDAPLTVSFDASSSSDPDGSIVEYEWDFDGDGAWDSCGDSSSAQHGYSAPGAWKARVRVTDNKGAQAAATAEVRANEVLVGPSAWWMFGRDPRHTRRSPYIGAQTDHLKWTYTTGDKVRSSPALGPDGTVYFGSDDHSIYAVNPDGSFKWSYATGNFYVSSSPAVATDGTVYVDSNIGFLLAIDPGGTLVWAYATGDERCSPTVGVEGTVYIAGGNWLFAVTHWGAKVWTYSTVGGYTVSCPAIGMDGTEYVGLGIWEIYAVKPDGSFGWTYKTGAFVDSSPAIGPDGTVYVGCEDYKLYAINPDGTLRWEFLTGGRVSSSPAIGADGTLYVGSDKLYALSSDGILKWAYPTEYYLIVSSPAIGADGTVYFGRHDSLYALNPDGTVKWSYPTGGFVESSPAIGADGTVYVGSDDGKLYAFGP